MLSPLDLPIQTRILVASTNEEFQGIKGLEHFEGHAIATTKQDRSKVGGVTYVNQVSMPSIKVRP